MSIYSIFNSPFEMFTSFAPSNVIVISDKEMQQIRERQVKAEIEQLQSLKQDNVDRIERLDQMIAKLQKQLPAKAEEGND